MKRRLFLVFAVLSVCLSGCKNEPDFTLRGTVTGAKDKTLYLSQVGINQITVLDSIKLKEGGHFEFKQPAPDGYDFYRLQIDKRIINVAVDSTEIITVNADFENFSKGYTIEGSENCKKIKELTLMQMELQRQVNSLIKNSGPAYGVTQDSIYKLVNNYKEKVKNEYIYKDPTKSYSYFALFQTVNGQLIFNPQNSREDIKSFAAVATNLNLYHPHSQRAMNLYNITIKGIRNTREEVVDSATVAAFNKKVTETGIINIELKDQNEQVRQLTSLKGKVVLLDFTVFQDNKLAAHNIALRELYNKYAGEGFEIYQVSLDNDRHFWKTAADNLPWICVYDENGVNSSNVKIYGVSKLPSFFLIDRENNIVARDENIKNLEEEIQKLLKK